MPLKTHLDDAPTLNLTAMLDVMFLLIIFFMLGTRFVDDERKIGLRVPEVVDRGALTASPARKEVNIFPTARHLDGTAVTRQLTTRLAVARRQYSAGRARAATPEASSERRLGAGGVQTAGIHDGEHGAIAPLKETATARNFTIQP